MEAIQIDSINNVIKMRASSLPELFDCPARWEAKHILGMNKPTSGAAWLGTSTHASTAAYDQAILDESPISIDDAADVFIDSVYNPTEEVDWEDRSQKEVEKVGLALHTNYCSKVAPKMKYLGVEVTCESLEIVDLGLVLTGTTDRIYLDDKGRTGISDIKTGSRIVGSDGKVNAAGHGAQLGVYELLAEKAINQPMDAPALVIGLQSGKTKTSQRTAIGELGSPRYQLIGDEQTPGLLQSAANLIHSGNFYGNPKSYLCSARYCPRHAVCKYK
jgi:hypothetical protein